MGSKDHLTMVGSA